MSSRLGGLAIACSGKWRELGYGSGSGSHWFTQMSRDAVSAVETPAISRRRRSLMFTQVLALLIPPAAGGGWFIPSLPQTRKILTIPPAAAGGWFIPRLCFPL